MIRDRIQAETRRRFKNLATAAYGEDPILTGTPEDAAASLRYWAEHVGARHIELSAADALALAGLLERGR